MVRALLVCAALIPCVPLTVATAEPGAQVTVRGEARPSFRMTPLVQRLSGRQGQRLKFHFEVHTLGEAISLRIRTVELKQQLNGLVVADEAAPPPVAVQLSGPLQLELKAAETVTIQGQVDVPISAAPFHTWGILVTDLGRPLQGRPASGQAGVQVRFVTQYLLRVEVQVPGGRQENAKQLRVESAGLVERDGRALAEIEVANPTEAAVEFQAHGRLLHPDGTPVLPSFGLGMPVRGSQPAPERFESLIFARNRLLLSAPVPEPVFPGHYELEVEWLSARRKCGRARFPLVVGEGDFPAQDSEFAHIARSLRVSPAQIELSLAARGNRRLPLRIANTAAQPLQVRLSMHNPDGSAAEWALVTPSDLLLPGGRGRNVLVTAQPGGRIQHHHYGVLRVEVGSGTAIGETRDLPVALLAAGDSNPSVQAGPLRWNADGERPAFVVPLANRGPVHLPLYGHLTISDLSGRRMEFTSGFGRWLLPGEEQELRFPFHHRLAPGTYDVRVQVQRGEGQEPLTITEQVQVR